MPDDHSESVPPLPIPNRTVKRLHADDSADSRVKVGNRQAPLQHQKPHPTKVGFLRLRTPETQYKILCRRDRKGVLDSRSQPPRDNAPPCREARRENEAIRQAMNFITNGPPLRYPRYCLAQMRQFLSRKSASVCRGVSVPNAGRSRRYPAINCIHLADFCKQCLIACNYLRQMRT